MDQIKAGVLGIIFGAIFALSGIFNWKFILQFNFFYDTWIEMFGLKVYRIIYVIIGMSFILWIAIGWVSSY